ncbi:glutathione S-transferase [Elysia marginata]|uniref:Glutathione S-transferase n=1 Tax=Elysia marginata TaxID=1093978 RepID=A0AAV4EG04_9GAST|nr:glutathione S-transferase [Elysia marginata]
MYGKTAMETFKIDEVVCLVNDFIAATVKVMYEKDETRKVTLADIFVYDFMWSMNSRDANILNNFPLLQEHLDKIGSLPQIKAYVDARKPTEA